MRKLTGILLIIISFSCRQENDSIFKSSCVNQGDHFSHVLPKLADYTEDYEFIFTESCRYNLHDSDQGDWNKLFGISESLDNHTISMMWAWRYDTVTQLIEITPYQHDYKLYSDAPLNRHFYNDIITTIEVGDTVRLSIENHVFNWEVMRDNEVVVFTEKSNRNNNTLFLIFNYFGGNKTAPQDIEILYRKL